MIFHQKYKPGELYKFKNPRYDLPYVLSFSTLEDCINTASKPIRADAKSPIIYLDYFGKFKINEFAIVVFEVYSILYKNKVLYTTSYDVEEFDAILFLDFR